jgi:prolyl-tRNA synthetase
MSDTKPASQDNAISPSRDENFPEWYQQVVRAADLAEVSAVRGCMVIKPWGYALWEIMQRVLDDMFKETGHVNAYFPLLIPLSLLEKEAEHIKGFAKECAVVTHHRLEQDSSGKLKPAGELEEPYVIRPTSELIIGQSYSKWVQSYRDLPILINQWANVFRWEMRTRLFLRTAEFLWQEGHTVHATAEEAQEETLKMLDVYETFARDWLAIPVIKGKKTLDEKFPGAVDTYTIEAMMQDRKAVQAGTSHFLGQNFAKASDIKFLNEKGESGYAWTTSWGVSTRLIGALIMTHSDDNGLVLPPKIAPKHVVLMPIYKSEEDKTKILNYVKNLAATIKGKTFAGSSIRVEVDNRDIRGGEKAWQHIKKGVPLRVEIGPKDLAAGTLFVGRRDFAPKQKFSVSHQDFIENLPKLLEEIQSNILERATKFRDENLKEVNSIEEFRTFFTPAKGGENELHGGFAAVHWNESAIDHPILSELKVSPRCIPLEWKKENGTCIFTGKKSDQRVIFAKNY